MAVIGAVLQQPPLAVLAQQALLMCKRAGCEQVLCMPGQLEDPRCCFAVWSLAFAGSSACCSGSTRALASLDLHQPQQISPLMPTIAKPSWLPIR